LAVTSTTRRGPDVGLHHQGIQEEDRE